MGKLYRKTKILVSEMIQTENNRIPTILLKLLSESKENGIIQGIKHALVIGTELRRYKIRVKTNSFTC
jgi:hypothetical protein